MNNLLLVFLGGGLGSMSRYGVSLWIRSISKVHFPMATLVSNLLSCIVLGFAAAYFMSRPNASNALRVFLIIGFCGGFSTFSTFSYETMELFRSGNMLVAISNILISVTACVLILYFLTKQV